MNYVARIEVVLAETCNDFKVNGLSTWEPSDFYPDARKAVMAITQHDFDRGSREALLMDMTVNLKWSLPEGYHAACIEACVDELYDELKGDD